MGKCFLSHSSKDKPCVEKIVEIIGKSKCVYDKYNFDAGMETMDEILSGLDESDIFVYLISGSALNSKWIKNEFNEAIKRIKNDSKKLKKIFPIIIDPSINHDDPRIPQVLRDKYNLRIISSAPILARKITNQLAKLDDTTNINASINYYGRNLDISKFSDRYYSPVQNEIKSMIVYGLPGMGKKTFALNCLRSVKLVSEFHEPICISLSKNSSIQDLILQLCDSGFGNYNIKDIANLSVENCISILTELINKIQEYKEIVIIEDEYESIIKSGDIAYWYTNAIKKSENGLSIVITCNSKIDFTKQVAHSEMYFTELKELNPSDSMGLFNIYSSSIGINLDRSEREWFKDVFNGYPPQIIECANLIKDYGLDYVKDHSYLVSDYNTSIATKVLEKCNQFCDKKNMLSLLAVISKFGIISNSLIKKIIKVNPIYQESLNVLKKYSVCYAIGSYNEYIKINSVIQNYIERNHVDIEDNIKKLIDNELEFFNNNLTESNIEQWDISELKYFIKENMKNNQPATDSFVYPTLFLQTITELYNGQKFNRLIELVQTYKEHSLFDYYDKHILNHVERLYCQSLIKCNSIDEVFNEIQYFRDNNLFTDYYFLRGYAYRYMSDYSKAEKALSKSLEYFPKNYAAMRELTLVYMTIQDFDSAIVVARKNYLRNQENIFVIQAYFECILECDQLNEQQEKDLSNMYETINKINSIYETPIYFQLMAQYQAYYNKNIDSAIEYINKGLCKFNNNMYINRTSFDIYRKYNDINGMRSSLKKLEKSVNELSYKGLYHSRKAILDSYEGRNENEIREHLEIDCSLPQTSIESIIKKCRFK